MKFLVERASFSDAVSKLQKVVTNKTSMPVLEGILISAEEGLLTLATYNLEMGMKKEMYAKCEESGDIVINVRLLSDILRKLSGAQVEIYCDENLMCHIKSGEATFEIMGMAASDFPEMPSVSDGTKLSINAEVFCDMVKGTIFAVSQIEGTKPILTGLNISIKNNILQFVAIDGYRLARKIQKIKNEQEIEFTASGKAINEMVKLIDEETEKIDFIIGKRLILATINGYSFISRLLEGEFVKYEKLIPEEFKQKMTVKSQDIIESVDRVSLLINDTFTTPIRCTINENSLILNCATTLGRANEKVNISLEGDEFEIGLNSRYLNEALKACDSGNILFKLNGANSGVVIVSADEKNDEFLYLIMPMRLK
ncbi:MAG: DNA polymerase III subunit beta [Clostridia bacterium]|nr:DNA polymerase III subunit beta [Clostridia bacterium]